MEVNLSRAVRTPPIDEEEDTTVDVEAAEEENHPVMEPQPKTREKSKEKAAKKVSLAVAAEVADDSEAGVEGMELRDITVEEGVGVEDHEARVKVMPERPPKMKKAPDPAQVARTKGRTPVPEVAVGAVAVEDEGATLVATTGPLVAAATVPANRLLLEENKRVQILRVRRPKNPRSSRSAL